MPSGIASAAQDPDWVQKTLRDLQRQIDQMRTSSTLGASSLSSGRLTVNGGQVVALSDNGQIILYVGTDPDLPDVTGGFQSIFSLVRDTGETVLNMADLTSGGAHQSLQWFDRAGNVVIADDTDSGVGLARPYIPMGQWVDFANPTQTTTSTTFVTLQLAYGYRQHPKLVAVVMAQTPVGTTGEVQITDGTNVLAGPLTVPDGQTVYLTFGPVSVTSDYLSAETLLLQARRVSGPGTGTVGVRGLMVTGVQS